MDIEKINTIPCKPGILIAPLDWGLGHATRCIPLINELLIQHYEVIIAASGASAALLKKEFPQLQIIIIKGYNIRYSRKKFWLPFVLLAQFPKLLFKIIQERAWLKKWLQKNPVNLIISDNRLGLYHRTIPCVYITHQLKIKVGNTVAERVVQKIHYYFINKYRQCWVPDAPGDNKLAGELSHPEKLPATPIHYIGVLSRFYKRETVIKYDILFLISGPEPQRTIFEDIIFSSLKDHKGSALVIRGLPGTAAEKNIAGTSIKVHNHLSTTEINNAICESKLIISRSGYTTIMDLVKLQKNAVLVPTPGQTEQEYLGGYLSEKKYFYTVRQEDFSLEKVLINFEKSSLLIPVFTADDYKKIITSLPGIIK